MVHQGIITKQTEPTPWVNSLTYPKKANGKLRVCLDPKKLKQGHHQRKSQSSNPWRDSTHPHRSHQIFQGGQQQGLLWDAPAR